MPTKDPRWLENDHDALEDLERATIRLICEAMHLQLDAIAEEFRNAGSSTAGFADGGSELAINPQGETIADRYDYLGEDLTRLALDSIGLSRVPTARLFGAIDYKAARYVFLPDFSVKQALFVDSKAEKNALNNCRVQVTQTSLEVRQELGNGTEVRVPGLVQKIWEASAHDYVTTTLFVKYHYDTDPQPRLKRLTIAALPHGFLQEKYNSTPQDNIWNIGPSSPVRQEKFRTRINFEKLKSKENWRIQVMIPGEDWVFDE